MLAAGGLFAAEVDDAPVLLAGEDGVDRRLAPFARHEVDVETLVIAEVAARTIEHDGEDDGLCVGQVRVLPAVTHIEVGGRLRSLNLEDSCRLRIEGNWVAHVGETCPVLCQVVGVGHLALVGIPSRAGRVEHEVAFGNLDDGRRLALHSAEELGVFDGLVIVGRQAEQAEVLVLLSG